jgi:predicted nucleic acid-binding protein
VIVVDASALIAFILRENGWEKLADFMSMTMSVDYLVKEFYNAVWKAVRVRGVLSVDEGRKAIELFKQYREKNMVLEPEDKYLDAALEIALNHGLTIYDSLYIALALNNRKPLLTLDARQGDVARRLGVEVIEL